MKALFRGLKFTAWLLVATAVLVELLLQAGAVVVFLAHRPATQVAPLARTKSVLCVGDSWTHGMGSSDSTMHSYPAVLERLLLQSPDPSWRVTNGGQSGQNSRDVLLRLDSQLEESKPSIVCVLVGRNDRWSRPEQVQGATATERHDGYRFRWRLPRLAAWIADSARVQATEPATNGPEWQTKSLPTRATYEDQPWTWPNSSQMQAFRSKAWGLMSKNDVSGALTEFEACRALGDDPETHGALAHAYRISGQDAPSLRSLDWLRQQWSETKSVWVGRPLMQALSSWSRDEDSYEIAREFTQLFPDDSMGWGELGRSCFNLGRFEEARPPLDRCFATDKQPSYYALLRVKVEEFTHRPGPAARALFESYAAHNDTTWARSALNAITESPELTEQVLLDAFDAFLCDAGTRARLQILINGALVARDGTAAKRVLENHLEQIMTKCRSRNATVVFLEYPIDTPFRGTLGDVADSLGAKHIDVYSMFRKRTSEPQLQSMRSPDGHVNDDGYRIMAECVFEGLAPLLQAPK